MKTLIVTVALLVTSLIGAQNSIAPKFTENDGLVSAVYYHENGQISQEGTYKNEKLEGKWISYDINGNRTSVGEYADGMKVGKWLIWSEKGLTQVDYSNNKIASVKVLSETGYAIGD